MANLNNENKKFPVPKKKKTSKSPEKMAVDTTSPTAKAPDRDLPLNITVSAAVHREIKVYAAIRGVSMKKALLDGFKLYKEQTT